VININRIVVTGDFLRLNKNRASSQEINIRWLHNFIAPALDLVLDFPMNRLVFESDPRSLSSRIYAVNRLEPRLESWARLFNKRPQSRELALMYDYFDGALVVAFEMPEILRAALGQMEIGYIDFTIHPARFLDDLLFGVRSNLPGVDEALQPWVVCEEEIHVGAGLAMASVGRLRRLPCCDGVDDIALFAGQTTDDKVLIKNGKLLDPELFLDECAEISASHSKVLVKPHPLERESSIIKMLTRLFSNTQLVDNNFYYLLSHENLNTVYSLTSSTSIEAAYFGKRGVHLSDYPYQFTSDKAHGGVYLTIQAEMYSTRFWMSVLDSANIPRKACKAIDLPFRRNRTRDSLRSYWGADIFMVQPDVT